LHLDDGVFLVDSVGDNWDSWRLQFTELWSPNATTSPSAFHDHCVALLGSSESLSLVFTTLVPSSVSEETFWCRYLYARFCIIPHERALFLLESDAASFTSDPIESGFDIWKDLFFENWAQHDADVITDCNVALENSQFLSSQYRLLVPAIVSARDFWCRYLFLRALLVRNAGDDAVLMIDEPAQSSVCSDLLPAADAVHVSGNAPESESGVSTARGTDADTCSSSLSPKVTASRSVEACLDEDLLTEHASVDFQAPNLGIHSSSASEAVASQDQSISSSSTVTLQVPTPSSEVAGWDDWE